MKISVESVHFKADIKLIEFIKSKISKLQQFDDHIIGAEVFLRLDNTNTLENKISEIRLLIPGNDLFAKKQSRSFEQSSDDAVEALRRQLRKRKGKLSHV